MITFKGKSAEEIDIADVKEMAEGPEIMTGIGDMSDINHVISVARVSYQKNISDSEKVDLVRKAMRV
ncbi:hypothetical protein [Lelliottia wanjuensis]|uniref:hypothetical protein n=1 Tax=Lelliottia wanjuensis TaxID=3050585 RepID=UPI00254BE6C3|nr:hypothetical protein [Lelliottia sp. V106_16]MDK9358430.1 hypothetical protein [Lelliottia sp. V106_16]